MADELDRSDAPSPNPFRPISYTERLQKSPPDGVHPHSGRMPPLQPGQLYGSSEMSRWLKPTKPLAPSAPYAPSSEYVPPSGYTPSFAPSFAPAASYPPAAPSTNPTTAYSLAPISEPTGAFSPISTSNPTGAYPPLAPASSANPTGAYSPAPISSATGAYPPLAPISAPPMMEPARAVEFASVSDPAPSAAPLAPVAPLASTPATPSEEPPKAGIPAYLRKRPALTRPAPKPQPTPSPEKSDEPATPKTAAPKPLFTSLATYKALSEPASMVDDDPVPPRMVLSRTERRAADAEAPASFPLPTPKPLTPPTRELPITEGSPQMAEPSDALPARPSRMAQPITPTPSESSPRPTRSSRLASSTQRAEPAQPVQPQELPTELTSESAAAKRRRRTERLHEEPQVTESLDTSAEASTDAPSPEPTFPPYTQQDDPSPEPTYQPYTAQDAPYEPIAPVVLQTPDPVSTFEWQPEDTSELPPVDFPPSDGSPLGVPDPQPPQEDEPTHEPEYTPTPFPSAYRTGSFNVPDPQPPQEDEPTPIQTPAFPPAPIPFPSAFHTSSFSTPVPEPPQVVAPFSSDASTPFPPAFTPGELYGVADPSDKRTTAREPKPLPELPIAEPIFTDEIAAFFGTSTADTAASAAPSAPYAPVAGEAYWPAEKQPSGSYAPPEPLRAESARTEPVHAEPSRAKPPRTKASHADSPTSAPSAQKPPIRPWRVVALVACAAMLIFCAVAGGRIVIDLAHNEREMESVREEYRRQNGGDLQSSAARVELLPPGVTYQPTATPTVLLTPTPAPRIAINENAIASLNGRDNEGVVLTEEPTATPSPRTRFTQYPDNTLRNIMPSMKELHEQYSDVVGHLVIDGVLDEVVVQRNNTWYLTHNYRGGGSEGGSVFVDESCAIQTPPENLLLRGQSAVEGKVFAPLWQFVSSGADFTSSHASASLTTLYEEERYTLFAVIVADSDPRASGYFNYASHPTFTTDEAMLRYVEEARTHSLYPLNVAVTASDRLLTLATLGGTNGQTLVLLYRMDP